MIAKPVAADLLASIGAADRYCTCPIMMFSDTPLMGSTSACAAASISTSTVSSKEHLGGGNTSPKISRQVRPSPHVMSHLMSAPVSCLLIPCLVMAMR